MDLDDSLLLIAFRHRIREADREAGVARLRAFLGDAAGETAIHAALDRALAAEHIRDPVRLPPGALQCHWHLELTPAGVAAARALSAAERG